MYGTVLPAELKLSNIVLIAASKSNPAIFSTVRSNSFLASSSVANFLVSL